MAGDARTAIRSLSRAPGFTASVIVTLALGVGVSNSLFAAVNAALLKPLPYADPGRLVHVTMSTPSDGRPLPASYPDYRDWTARARTARSIAGYSRTNRTVSGRGAPERVAVTQVDANFFETLGVALDAGRPFRPDEQRAGHDHEVILTHAFWQAHFVGRPAVGATLQLSGVPHEVVGVLPASFEFALDRPDLFVPLGVTPVDETRRDSHWLSVIARLADGATPATARAELQAITDSATPPASSPAPRVAVGTLRDAIVGGFRRILLLLVGAALFVTLTASASLANLAATRAAGRRREFAVRAALGASTGRVLRGFAIELGVLALVGAAAALLVGWWTSRVALRFLPAAWMGATPLAAGVPLDRRVLLFSVGLAMAALLPALGIVAAGVRRTDVQDTLKAGAAPARATARLPWGGMFVATQVALALVLLVGTTLMVRSLDGLLGIGPGFRTDQLVSMSVALPAERYREPSQISAFYGELRHRVGALGLVQAAAVVDEIPLTKDDGAVELAAVNGTGPAPAAISAVIRSASPGYFRTDGDSRAGGTRFHGGRHHRAGPRGRHQPHPCRPPVPGHGRPDRAPRRAHARHPGVRHCRRRR